MKLTKEMIELCDKITTRSMEMELYPTDCRMTCFMDVENAAKHFNMRLIEWLEADDFNFAHDIIGIKKAINRDVHPVDFSNDEYFLPRFAGEGK